MSTSIALFLIFIQAVQIGKYPPAFGRGEVPPPPGRGSPLPSGGGPIPPPFPSQVRRWRDELNDAQLRPHGPYALGALYFL